MNAADAADRGQRTIEHLSGVLLACSAREAAQRDTLVAVATTIDTSFAAHAALWARAETAPAASFDAGKCRELARRLAGRGTWVVPTLVLHRALALGRDSAFRASPDHRAWAAYLPPFFPQFWASVAGSYPGYDVVYERHRQVVGILHRAGVHLLAGTDVMNPYVFPGFSLHDELALLQDAGLTPLEALRAATLNPARMLGATDSLGTVAPGKVADLVLVDADPLVDVRNTRHFRAVVRGGRYLDRVALDAVLADVRRVANPASSPGVSPRRGSSDSLTTPRLEMP